MDLLNNQSMWAMIPVQLLHHEPIRHVSMSEILCVAMGSVDVFFNFSGQEAGTTELPLMSVPENQ